MKKTFRVFLCLILALNLCVCNAFAVSPVAEIGGGTEVMPAYTLEQTTTLTNKLLNTSEQRIISKTLSYTPAFVVSLTGNSNSANVYVFLYKGNEIVDEGIIYSTGQTTVEGYGSGTYYLVLKAANTTYVSGSIFLWAT